MMDDNARDEYRRAVKMRWAADLVGAVDHPRAPIMATILTKWAQAYQLRADHLTDRHAELTPDCELCWAGNPGEGDDGRPAQPAS